MNRKIDISKTIKTIAIIGTIFLIVFAIIFAVVQDFNLLFLIADIVEVALIINCFLYIFYKTVFGGKWIRTMVLGFSSLLFIILSTDAAIISLAQIFYLFARNLC